MSRRAGAAAGSALLAVPAGLLTLFLGLPVLALLLRATLAGALPAAGGSREVVDALWLSLVTTAASLALTVVLGVPLAYALARHTFRGRGLVETLIDLPIVLPPSVAGLALLLLLGRRGPLGGPLDAIGISVPFSVAAVVLAQLFVSAPFFVRSARTGFAAVDRELEDAARVDGAGERAVFRSVTLPLASGALASGLVMSWARALGEFGATIMFAGNVVRRTQTLPLAVYSEFQSSLDASIAAAAILVLAAFGVLAAVRLIHWRPLVDLRSL